MTSIKTSTHLSLLLQDWGRDLFSVELDSMEAVRRLNHPLSDEGDDTEIWGSCNGLVALSNGNKEIVLWNPSTTHSKRLPVAELEVPGHSCFSHYIVYGFGQDPISDDYKLVRIAQYYNQNDLSFVAQVLVYSLRNNSWRRVQDFPFPGKYKREYGVFAKNALHWVVCKNPEPDAQSFLVAFDIGTDEFRVVELPDCLDRGFRVNVKSMHGSLCVIANYWEVHVVDVWMMEESWTKLVSVNQSMFTPPFHFVLPLAFSKNGNRVLLNINTDMFVWYDLRSKTFQKVGIEGVPRLFEAAMLVESFVPLN